MSDNKQLLMDYMQGLDIIDCHEHLAPESARVEREVDVLTLLCLYAYLDTTIAGRPVRPGENAFINNFFLDTSIPLEERWNQVWPYLQYIKYGSYYRATAIALKDIYGIDDLNEKTYMEATERIRAANKKGLYKNILRDKCRIETCLVQNGLIEGQDPPELFTPVCTRTDMALLGNRAPVDELSSMYGIDIEDLDVYLELLGKYMESVQAKGVAGFKIWFNRPAPVDMDAARKSFKHMLSGGTSDSVLESTVLDYACRKAGEIDWPVAVHWLMVGDGGDSGDRMLFDAQVVMDLVSRHPQTRFDLYHLGMPLVRDCIFIAKCFKNVFLNLCCCYVQSQEMTRRTISEILDTVPANKVFAFGGDYGIDVENVYGHLVMARDALSDALAERISRGHIDIEGAKHIARLWFYDNPVRFYGLK